MPAVAVLIPWRSGCPHRERALAWVLDRYAEHFPAWATVLGAVRQGPWAKGAAVAAAAAASDAEIFVVADADVWCDGIGDAVAAVTAGAAPWAIPHTRVKRLTQDATAALLAGGLVGGELSERAYRGLPGGGLVVLPAVTLQAVPLDPRFAGWGGEDEAWGYALDCLVGRPWRGNRPLWHLWHPPQDRRSRRIGSTQNERLRRRYARARASRARMESIVREVTTA